MDELLVKYRYIEENNIIIALLIIDPLNNNNKKTKFPNTNTTYNKKINFNFPNIFLP